MIPGYPRFRRPTRRQLAVAVLLGLFAVVSATALAGLAIVLAG